MPTFVYTSRCVGCGDCVDICPSDIMHYTKDRKTVNIEPDACWECLNCVKVCARFAIDVRSYADFVPMGHSISVFRDEKSQKVYWRIKYRNGKVKEFAFPIRTTPWGSIRPPYEMPEPDPQDLYSPVLSFEKESVKRAEVSTK
jgi:adenylylsulfate reductase subunit B